MTDAHIELLVAVGYAVGIALAAALSGVGAWFTRRAMKSIEDVNDAVNHRHVKKGEGALKLYDLVWENHCKATELIEWKRGYDGGPLDNGTKVETFVTNSSKALDDLACEVKSLKKVCPKCEAVDVAKDQQKQNDRESHES